MAKIKGKAKTNYTLSQLRVIQESSPKQARAMYTQFRDILQKRQKRLQQGGFAEYDLANQHWKKLKELTSDDDIVEELWKMQRAINDPRTKLKTMREWRKKQIKALQDRGYDFINNDNLKKFGNFMEDYRAYIQDNMKYNAMVVEAFEAAEDKGINPQILSEMFNKWAEDEESIQQVVDRIKGEGDYEGQKISGKMLERFLEDL